MRKARLHADQGAIEVDAAPREVEQLAEAQTRVERRRQHRREHRILDRAGHRLELDRLEDVERAGILDGHALGVLGRVRLDQLAALSELEQGMQQDKDLLRRPRREVRREQLAPEGVDVVRREGVPALVSALDAAASAADDDDLVALDGVQRRVGAEVRQQVATRPCCARPAACSPCAASRTPGSAATRPPLRRRSGPPRLPEQRDASAARASRRSKDRGEFFLRALRREGVGRAGAVSRSPDHRAARRPPARVLDVRTAERARALGAGGVPPVGEVLPLPGRSLDLEVARDS